MLNSLEKQTPKIGIFSFFAGAGFLDLGFEMTKDFETLFVNEYHKPFLDIYKSSRTNLKIAEPHFGYNAESIETFLNKRGSQFLGQSIEEARATHDLIGFIGGPPCPDFSVGGKNKGVEGENGKLSGTYVELITRNNPDFFLFENVKGLYRTKKHREFFNSIKTKLIANGYYLTEKLINAIEFGAPQDRERIILIGFKRNILTDFGLELNGSPILKAFPWDSKISHISKIVLSLNWPTQETFVENSTKRCPNDVLEELTVEHWFKKNDVENHPNSNHYFQPRAGLPKFLTIYEGDDLKKSYKRLHRWRYSPTAAYGNNEVHLHPYKARRISVADALAIQSLPKEFVIPDNISLTNMFKTVGNGVPFLAAKGLAETILDYIKNVKIKNPEYAEVIG
ncbi:DNA (cytosine-5)-methyltransferase 1 [Reichenbachiella faecimaris]|uniref:DNA (cytosine-5-)-methyltransferase n=1 Tax=Reichenbachiella faecimaris TaxID=692418 RepID=A0A1W2G881_REIFA|nr:DNA cytosine methyltransferase [Reichenbachiella faecimaris]SMD32496.1 DNA (cytosine-5)-methyltransferase 1 [Reichenbachiella faecimaris]